MAGVLQSMAEPPPTVQPFRFMDLPKELRLCVYEFLPRRVVHTRVDLPPAIFDQKPTLILVTRVCSTALLRVSRTIHSEAHTIVGNIVGSWVSSHPLRAFTSCTLALEMMDRIIYEVDHCDSSSSFDLSDDPAPGDCAAKNHIDIFNKTLQDSYYYMPLDNFIVQCAPEWRPVDSFNTASLRRILALYIHQAVILGRGNKSWQVPVELIMVRPALGHWTPETEHNEIYSALRCLDMAVPMLDDSENDTRFKAVATLACCAADAITPGTSEALEPGFLLIDKKVLIEEEDGKHVGLQRDAWMENWVPS